MSELTQRSFRAMGCSMVAAVAAPAPQADAGLAAMVAVFARWEQVLSRFRPDSELSRINRATGRWHRPSPTLRAVLRAAHSAAAFSEGLVSPVLLDAIERAGYDQDFAAIRDDGPAVATAVPAADWRSLRLTNTGLLYVPPGIRLDLGGVAKGWAADEAVRLMAGYGPALVDAGGDIAVSGPQADGSPWLIGVADPRGGERPIALLELSFGGIATSGRDYRRWRRGTQEQHHIIDPRSGAPAVTDLLAVTVIGPDALIAEAAAKTVLILGSTGGMDWLRTHPELAGLLVTDDGQVLRTRHLRADVMHQIG